MEQVASLLISTVLLNYLPVPALSKHKFSQIVPCSHSQEWPASEIVEFKELNDRLKCMSYRTITLLFWFCTQWLDMEKIEDFFFDNENEIQHSYSMILH